MKFEIKAISKNILFIGEYESLREALEAAVKEGISLIDANLENANLENANLKGANLWGTNLEDSNLEDSNLEDSNLRDANLRDANLRGVSLIRANLWGANLEYANLWGANLWDANLWGANLWGAQFDSLTIIETGETWKEYVEQVVPALLTACGQQLDSFSDVWECHSWENCPLAYAFGVHRIEDIPVLLQPRAEQFLRYFDARLIPCPKG